MYLREIQEDFVGLGFQKFKAVQVYKWLQKGAVNFDEMTDVSKDMREKLSEKYYICVANIEKKLISRYDDTVKYLFSFNDGECVESVIMKYHHGYTICLSTQVGCKMGCTFCATGMSGFSRNLTASEILSQIHSAQYDLGIRISNIVLMGMGEPLDNFENVIRFLKLVSDEKGLNIGMRHISLSTCGLVNRIYDLAELNLQLTLSVSLHAPNDEIRNKTMPVNKKFNIEDLLKACRYYANKTKRRISFEYAMIDGVNDSNECALQLAKRLKGMLCHVNLIPVNAVKGGMNYKKSKIERQKAFIKILGSSGITATVRRTLGSDINASCGQLRRNTVKKENLKKMEAYGKSDVGLVRKLNEDSFFIKKISENEILAIVCDGMGGVNGGEVASKMAVDIISDSVLKECCGCKGEQLRELINKSIILANSKIFEFAEKNNYLSGMGTTAVVVFVCENIAYIAYVGDSRCYLVKNGEAAQITEDHSVVQELINLGKLTKEQAQNHPDRNLITRAVGVENKMAVDFVEIDFVKDDILILCSDGFSSYVEDKYIGELSKKYKGRELVDNYIKLALDNGGYDNVTVVTIEK